MKQIPFGYDTMSYRFIYYLCESIHLSTVQHNTHITFDESCKDKPFMSNYNMGAQFKVSTIVKTYLMLECYYGTIVGTLINCSYDCHVRTQGKISIKTTLPPRNLTYPLGSSVRRALKKPKINTQLYMSSVPKFKTKHNPNPEMNIRPSGVHEKPRPIANANVGNGEVVPKVSHVKHTICSLHSN